MMKHKYLRFLLALGFSLLLVACGTNSNDVPSLAATPIPDAAGEAPDDEALVMEFTNCVRNEGLDIADPIVDANGNIQMPEIVEGSTVTKADWDAAYNVCGAIIANITIKKQENDRVRELEDYLEIVACMNESGIVTSAISEPTLQTLDTWKEEFKNTFDWDDPDTQEAIDTCFSGGDK